MRLTFTVYMNGCKTLIGLVIQTGLKLGLDFPSKKLTGISLAQGEC